MAASALAEPGTKFGPCKKGCKHCAANRKLTESSCRFCGGAIGYDKAFYRDDEPRTGWGALKPPSGWVHAVCFETAIRMAPRRVL